MARHQNVTARIWSKTSRANMSTLSVASCASLSRRYTCRVVASGHQVARGWIDLGWWSKASAAEACSLYEACSIPYEHDMNTT